MKATRQFPEREEYPDKQNIRPAFFHDTDRIIHSQAYTRYIDKTQVFSLFENDHITHRVLHVQLVSKIARVIGRALRLNEDLIEAIALAHDIGHVPYGHVGERFLNSVSIKYDNSYFCHNAQSVRFLMYLENKGDGLNLTLQVLDGILAHNGEFLNQKLEPIYDKSWNIFLTEYKKCWEVKDFSKQIIPMTLEACVVRVADIVAYVGRDIEDAIEVGLIKKHTIPKRIRNALTIDDNCINKSIINTIVLDIINRSYNKKYILLSSKVYKALKELLEEFNYEKIYYNEAIHTQDQKIESMFDELSIKYQKDIETNNTSSSIFKLFLENMNDKYKDGASDKRKVIDFISGMTDDFFNNEFKEYKIPKSYGFGLRVKSR